MMSRFFRSSGIPALLFGLCVFFLLFLLWLPGMRLPITSDTSVYMLLGESLWRSGQYVLDGVPYAKHLPLHPFLSYVLVWLTGSQIGMKVSSLLAGMGVLTATFFLFRRPFGGAAAALATVFVLFHHGFVLMTILGSADLLFTALFLGSLAAFQAAGDRPKMYLLAGAFLGLASLTRYNGILLFLFYPLFILYKRPHDRMSAWFWGGMTLALVFFGLWFTRNTLVFGNPFHTSYSSEFAQQVPSVPQEVFRNVLYYLNPLHNVLPAFFALSLWGVWREGRRHPLLILGIIAGVAFALFWWVKGMRFAFPGYPVLLGFAAVGLIDLWRRRSWRSILVLAAMVTAILHAGALCVYAYGQCNAWVDRSIGRIPPDLGLSSEGLYGISLAIDFINSTASHGAAVLVPSVNYWTWQNGVLRADLHVVPSLKERCPAYSIEQNHTDLPALFTTNSAPRTQVVLQPCTPF